MAQEIEVTLRIRVADDQLQSAGVTAEQFAQNMILFEHGFDIPYVVLSQRERDTDPEERCAIVMTKVIVGIEIENIKKFENEEQFMRDYYGNDN